MPSWVQSSLGGGKMQVPARGGWGERAGTRSPRIRASAPVLHGGSSRKLACIHPHTYKVPGRRQGSLIPGLPRRVLLGNWASGIRGSRNLGGTEKGGGYLHP